MSKCSFSVKWDAFEQSTNWMLDASSGCKQHRHGLSGTVACHCFIIIFVFPSPRPLPCINNYSCFHRPAPFLVFIINLIYTRKGAGRWKHENDNKTVASDCAEWAMLMWGRSLLGQSSRYLAMMTRPVLAKPFKTWSMIVKLIPVNDILISSQSSFVCPKLSCIELLISLHNGRHLFADDWVRPIAMKFGWDKESVSSLKFWKFHLNPSNFNRKLTMMFKLDLENMTFTAFRPRCRTGWCKNSICFAQKMDTCMHFMHPSKIVQIG